MSETAKIDTLELNIRTNADKAAEGIENLSTAIGHLKESSKGYGSRIKKLAETISKPTKEVDGIRVLADATEEVASSVKETGSAAKNSVTAVREVGKGIGSAGKGAEKGAKGLKKFFQQLKRIAVYRLIRSALKAIVNSCKEGISNLYQFSTLVNGQFSQSMDNLASSLGYLKNTLGAFLANFIEAFEPVLVWLIDAFAQTVEPVSKFIAILFGKDYYYKATKSALKYADAISEVKNQLMGFDELNVLNGSGTSTDYSSMFEKVSLDGATTDLMLKLQDISVSLGDSFSLSGANPIAEQIAGALVGLGIGFKYGVKGALLGFVIGFALTLVAQNIKVIAEDGLKSWASSVRDSIINILKNLSLPSWLTLGVSPTSGLLAFSLVASLQVLIKSIDWLTKDEVGVTIPSGETIPNITAESDRTGGVFSRVSKRYVAAYANGGTVNTGSLFWAGENGAELITQVGSRSTVFNEDQLTVHLESANSGVIQAISALNANVVSAINKKNTSINVNDVRLATNSQNMRYAK